VTPPPATHKLLVTHLRDRVGGEFRVVVYRDNNGKQPIPVGTFGAGTSCLHSTIGAFEQRLPVPPGAYELAACGPQPWLPNALASSIYWLKGRSIDEWPLVCEDVVRHNARSRFRHMAYVPSSYAIEVAPGMSVRWLLGVPISDKDIGVSNGDVTMRVAEIYPSWLLRSDAQPFAAPDALQPPSAASARG
jgi:hypothetical protein